MKSTLFPTVAVIQGLHQIVKAKDAKIGALEKLNATMQKKSAAIEKRLGNVGADLAALVSSLRC